MGKYTEETVNALALQVDELDGKYAIVSELLEKERAEVARLMHVIDRDRYIVAAGITAIETSLRAREWTLEGRGPYEWDDDDYRKEFGLWMKDVYNATDVLRKISFDKTDCTTDPDRVQAAREAAKEILKQPLGHREMIAADLGLFDKRDIEIRNLKNKLLETQMELVKYKPNHNYSFCIRCGYFGEVPEKGFHRRPDGGDCNYYLGKTVQIDTLTPESKNIFVDTVVMMCQALGSVDPNIILASLQTRMKYAAAIDVLQTCLERGVVDFNSDGYLIASNNGVLT